jgi:hypothetical protein
MIEAHASELASSEYTDPMTRGRMRFESKRMVGTDFHISYL